MKKGVLYLNCCANQQRFVQQIQADQTKESFTTCTQTDIEIVHVFNETSINDLFKRDEFKSVLSFLERNKTNIDFLIVWDYSRLTRKYKEYQSLLKILDQYKIRIMQIRPNYYWEEKNAFIDDSQRTWNQNTDHE